MSKRLHEEFHTLETGMEIRYSVSFNRDQTNWGTGEKKKIGYQVSATPVKRKQVEGGWVTEFGAFTGFDDCLLECERQSSKRLQTAIQELQKRIPETYNPWFIKKYPNGKTE